MVYTKKFSQFISGNLTGATNSIVGVSAPSGGNNIQLSFPLTWTTATRPNPAPNGLLGYNTNESQYEYWDAVSSDWVPLASGAIGTVSEVGTGTGLTGGPITYTGTISFAEIAANSLWANTTGSTAVPTVTPLSTFLLSANNLSDVTNAAEARANIGLEIGVNVEAWSSILDDIVGGLMPASVQLQVGSFDGGSGASSSTFWRGDGTWSAPAGSGTVDVGLINQLAYYAAAGDTVSGLATADNGVLITSALGVPSISSTLPSQVQDNITALGTVSSGVWESDNIGLAYGGTNASLTASNGGIVYSTASALAILSGTATANLPLLSGSSGAPTWGNYALHLGGTLTTAGALTTSGSYAATFNFTNTTGVTFPTSGTLATTSQLPSAAALTASSDTNVTLTLGGTPSTALLQATSITAGWSGTLSLARGGLAANLTASNGGIFYSTASAGAILSGTSTANQALLSGSSSAPTWSTATYPATTTINQLLYSSANNTITGLTTITAGVLTTSSGAPTWATQLPLTLGGTNANLTASNGGIVYSGSSALAILGGTSTAGQLLLSGSSAAPTWSTTTYPTTNAINTLLYASSANVMAALPTANSSTLVTSAAGVPSWSQALPSAVQVAVGSLNSGTSASSSTFWRGDGTWASPSGSGTVNSGTANDLAYYAATGTAVSGLTSANSAVLTTNASGVPSWTLQAVFRAHSVASFTPSTMFTTLPLATTDFDTISSYNNMGTGNAYSYMPTVAGYYRFSASFLFNFSNVNTGKILLYKNGAAVSQQSIINGYAGAASGIASVTDIIYCNGTTNYVQVYITTANSSVSATTGTSPTVYFCGELVL